MFSLVVFLEFKDHIPNIAKMNNATTNSTTVRVLSIEKERSLYGLIVDSMPIMAIVLLIAVILVELVCIVETCCRYELLILKQEDFLYSNFAPTTRTEPIEHPAELGIDLVEQQADLDTEFELKSIQIGSEDTTSI